MTFGITTGISKQIRNEFCLGEERPQEIQERKKVNHLARYSFACLRVPHVSWLVTDGAPFSVSVLVVFHFRNVLNVVENHAVGDTNVHLFAGAFIVSFDYEFGLVESTHVALDTQYSCDDFP